MSLLLFLALNLASAQDDVTQLPEIVEQVEAAYPEEARAEGIETDLLLEIDIDAEGNVEDVRVVEPSMEMGLGFDEAAVAAVRQFKFSPAYVGEEPVPVMIEYRYHFTITEVVVPPEPSAEPVVNLSGQIRERGLRTRLSGLKVTVFQPDGEAFEATTDDEGDFQFFDLSSGTWNIAVSGDGYRTFETSEEVVEGERTDAVLFVFREVTSDFDVVVEGEKPRKEVTRHTLTVDQIERIPGTFGDPLAVVQNLPGVSPQGFGDGTIIVRGASPEDTGLYLGGSRIPIFYHFGALRSVVPVNLLEEITFYPGNAPLQYGRLTGGVLEVSPKIIDPDAVHGYVDINLFDSAGLIEVPLGDKVDIAIAGRRSYVDAVLGAVIPEDSSFQLTAAPQFHDYQAVVAWHPTPDHDLQLFYLGSGDQFVALFDEPRDLNPLFTTTDFEARLKQQHAAVYHEWRINENLTNSLRIGGLSAQQYFSAGPELRLDIRRREMVFRNTLSARLHDRVELRTGADAVVGRDKVEVYLAAPTKEGEFFAYEQDANRYIEDEGPNNHGGGFAELTVEPIDGLSLIGGARTDYYGIMDQWTVDPRFTARAKVHDMLALKAGIGWFHQAPTVDELAREFGNPNLETEAARHVSAGFEFEPNDWFVLDVTGFYNDLYNSVNQTDRGVTKPNGQVKPLRYDNSGSGRVRGLEVLAKHEMNRNFSGWIAYTLSKAERMDDFGKKNKYRYFDYDRPHVLTAIGSYRLPRNWEFSGRFRYMSGQPTTPVKDSVFVADDDLYAPIVGEVNTDRQLAAHTLDVRIDKTWDFRRWSLDTYIDVQNVYNNTKTGGTAYNYDYTESEAAPGFPIFPALGIRGEW